ncbi:Forkhead-associated (FHA) domain [Trinorchestia longiramus]|nr:Forkhead-associated (FHA) domain [Trinorchestia longiramus]
MVNVVGVGVGGSGQQQEKCSILSLSDFILSTPPLSLPPAPPDIADRSALDMDLHKQEMEPQQDAISALSNKNCARATLQCRPNSHPFNERSLMLSSPVKIGRSVARSRPCSSNSIFDCKVLSRNHALLWCEDNKFYLQDTKSSNGTFVNNQRLSKGSEESAPREVCSGDIVQFGVEVMENSRKVTHGCIIATLRLYLPNGEEAKASPSVGVQSLTCEAGIEVQQLRTCLQEAHFREAAISNKLQALTDIMQATQVNYKSAFEELDQRTNNLIPSSSDPAPYLHRLCRPQEAASHSWSAMIGEDRLLQKLDMMEAQLLAYTKNWPEDELREEVRRLLEEKCQYETHMKESLARMLNHKSLALAKLADAERALANTEAEVSQLRVVAESSQHQIIELFEQQALHIQQIAHLKQKTEFKERSDSNASDFNSISGDSENYKNLESQTISCDRERELLEQIENATAEAELWKQQLESLRSLQELQADELSGSGELFSRSNHSWSSLWRMASFVARIASCVAKIASFVAKIASFVAKIASFVAKIASFVAKILSFVAKILSFVVRIASSYGEEGVCGRDNIVDVELRMLGARLKQHQLEVASGQARLAAIAKELSAAQKTEEALKLEKNRLQERLTEALSKAASRKAVSEHLHRNIGALQCALDNSCCSSTSAVRKDSNLSSTDLTINGVDNIKGRFKDLNNQENNLDKNLPDKTDNHLPETDDGSSSIIIEKADPCNDEIEIPEKTKDEEKEVEKKSDDEDSTIHDESDDGYLNDDDSESLSVGSTLTLMNTTVAGENDLRDDAHISPCLTTLQNHLQDLKELRVSSSRDESNDARDVASLREQLQCATAAAATATQHTSKLRQSLAAAESYAQSRSEVVTELQQSTARLSAVGAVIKKQLEQLNAQLLEQRQLLSEERMKGLNMQERLAEAEALTKKGLEQTDALNKQLEQLRIHPTTPYSFKSANPVPVVSSPNPIANGSTVNDSSDTAINSIASSDDSATSVNLQTEIAADAEESTPDQTVTTVDGPAVVSEFEQKEDIEDRDATLQKKPKVPASSNLNVTDSPVSGTRDADVMRDHDAMQKQLRQIQEECEELRKRLADNEDDFYMLSIQNKTAFAMSIVPLFVLLVAFVAAFHEYLAYITGTKDYY